MTNAAFVPVYEWATPAEICAESRAAEYLALSCGYVRAVYRRADLGGKKPAVTICGPHIVWGPLRLFQGRSGPVSQGGILMLTDILLTVTAPVWTFTIGYGIGFAAVRVLGLSPDR